MVIPPNQKGQNQGGNLPAVNSLVQLRSTFALVVAILALGVIAGCGSDSSDTAETAASVSSTTMEDPAISVPTTTQEPVNPFDAATKALKKEGFKVTPGDGTTYTPPAVADIEATRGGATYRAALFTTTAEAKAAAGRFNLDNFGPSADVAVEGSTLYVGTIEQPAALPDFDLFVSLAVPEQP